MRAPIILFAVVAYLRFRWSLWMVGLLAAGLLVVDLAFWGANLPKVPHGGWFPLVVALSVFTLMVTWKRGRELLARRFAGRTIPVDDLLASLRLGPPQRVSGTSVFMTSNPDGVPRALLHNLKHNKVLHERVIILTVQTLEIPRVDDAERITVAELGMGFWRVVSRYGFTEEPDVPTVLRSVRIPGYAYREMADSFFLGEVTVLVSHEPGMARWRLALFDRMSRNALRAYDFFGIPPNRVVGLGAQVEL